MEVNWEKTMNLWVKDSRWRRVRRCRILAEVVMESREGSSESDDEDTSSSSSPSLLESRRECSSTSSASWSVVSRLTTSRCRDFTIWSGDSSSVSVSSDAKDSPPPSAFSSSLPPALPRFGA